VTSVSPLRLYLYEEGLARFATERYEVPHTDNIDNEWVHLTNYAINKDHSNFQFNRHEEEDDVGHKRSLTAVFT
jgi:tubulin polyglutamylase TTLL6/13